MSVTIIGYARVSTDDQNLDLQRDALTRAGCTRLYEDRISGAKAARPGLALALEVARSGDQLVVWRLDRLQRTAQRIISAGKRKPRNARVASVVDGALGGMLAGAPFLSARSPPLHATDPASCNPLLIFCLRRRFFVARPD